MQKQYLSVFFLCISCGQYTLAAESSAAQSSECPAVILCSTGDNSKQTYTGYLANTQAYECYYKAGDAEMTKIAGKAMTDCQTMYGSINPTIRKQ